MSAAPVEPINEISNALFRVNDPVRHVKTGKLYAITGTPDHCRIEAGWMPAYIYTDGAGLFVVRPQAEMEDGRFVSEKISYPYPATDADGNKVFVLSPEFHVLASDVEKGA